MTRKLHSLKSLDDLISHNLINPQESHELEKVITEFPVTISEQMRAIIDTTKPADPIAKQFVPSVEELTSTPEETNDPISDDAFTTVKGIIHRYHDRCLFTPVHVCPVYCRFCFRKDKLGTPNSTLSPQELNAAFAYIENHPEIWEVILTGGDPLILKPISLKNIIRKLNAIPHVEIIRIHTRIPVVESHRINDEMIAALKSEKPVYVVLHANHPDEFTFEAVKACAKIVDAGLPMLSQSTLLKDVNDNIDTLSQLMRCFIKNRIKPYYLHQGDFARGTSHFRTSIETGQQLMKQLRGRFSGICQPTYVLDIPGGYGKMPIGPNYLNKASHDSCHTSENQHDTYKIEDFSGNIHTYPPAKK